MKRVLFLVLILLAGFIQPAAAHALRVFASIEGNSVSGYAFFIGGGRAKDTPWRAADETGRSLGSGRTGAEGEFHFTVPEPMTSDITVTIDTQEGHAATRVLKAARFGADDPATSEPTAAQADPAISAAAPTQQPAEADTAALVEAAVQRQVTPLLERIEEMDARLRFADIVSGIFLIIGLAGIGLWAQGRRR